MDAFQVAAGSVTGLGHIRMGRGNQDSTRIIETEDFIVAVVTDGCSDGKYSEMGAHLGAAVIASSLAYYAQYDVARPWDTAEYGAKHVLSTMLRHMSMGTRDRKELLVNYLLFTVMAVVITPESTSIASIGDGRAWVNGEDVSPGKFDNNAPHYLAFSFTETSLPPEAFKFKVLKTLPTCELQSVIIGSDGLDELEAAAGLYVPSYPGAEPALVGSVDQFLGDRYFKNKDAVRRRLAQINGGVGPDALKGGHIEDDVSLVAVRRKAVTP